MRRRPPGSVLVLGLVLPLAAGCATASGVTRDLSEGAGQLGSSIDRSYANLRKRIHGLLEPKSVKFRRALEQLKTGSADDRRAAILFLDRKWTWSNQDARDVFVTILANRLRTDPDEVVRAVAARALGHYAEPAVAQALVDALADRDEYVRVEAARSLGESTGADAITALVRALRADASPRVRAAAAASLGEPRTDPAGYPDRAVLGALAAALDEDDFAVVLRSAEALARLTGQDLGDDRQAWEEWLASSPP